MLVGFLAPPSHEPVTSASICHRIVDDVFFDVALNIEWSDLALPDVPIFETSLDLIAPKLLQILWMAMAGKPDSPATGPLIFLTFFQHAFGFVFGKERFALKYHTIVLVSVEHGPEENTFWRAVKGWPPMASTIMSVCFFLLDHGSVSNVYWIYWCPMHIGSSKWGFPVFGGYDPMKSNFMPRLVLVKSHVLFTLFFFVKILWKSNTFGEITQLTSPSLGPICQAGDLHGRGEVGMVLGPGVPTVLNPGINGLDSVLNQWKSSKLRLFRSLKIWLNLPRSMEETLTSHKLITCMAGIIQPFCVSLLYNRRVGRVTPIELSWKSK